MNQYHLNTFNIFKNPHLVLLILILAARIILKILAPSLPMAPGSSSCPGRRSRHQAWHPPYGPRFDWSLTTRFRVSPATRGLGCNGLPVPKQRVSAQHLAAPHAHCCFWESWFLLRASPTKQSPLCNVQIALHPRSLSWSCGTSQILCFKHFCSHVTNVLIYVSVAQKDAHLWDLALSLVYPVPFILIEQEEINNKNSKNRKELITSPEEWGRRS